MCQHSIFTLYFHLLVQVLTIFINLETGRELGEYARVAVQGDGTLLLISDFSCVISLKIKG